MTPDQIFGYVDHTLLKPTASWREIVQLCGEAVQAGAASVCVPPCYVGRIRRDFKDIVICTVIGFPLGYSVTEAKTAEIRRAIQDGADELDMVINQTDVKNGLYREIADEIMACKAAAGRRILKVIVETCNLTEEEKIELCRCVTDAGADYIKTSTGFGASGASIEDIRLFKRHLGPNVRIKAAGGIRTKEDMELFISEGCDRLGTSSAVKILSGGQAQAY